MKDQASLNLLIVDSPIDNKALEGHLMLRATSSGLKVYDNSGSESQLGSGTSWNDLTDKPTYLTVPVNAANGIVQLDESGLVPTSLIPPSPIDLSAYSGGVKLNVSDSAAIQITDTNHISIGSAPDDYGQTAHGLYVGPKTGYYNNVMLRSSTTTGVMGKTVVIGGFDEFSETASLQLKGTNISIEGPNGNASLNSINMGGSYAFLTFSSCITTINATDQGSDTGIINLVAPKLQYNGNVTNTPNGLAVLDSTGHLPSAIIPASTVDLSAYEGPVSLIANNSDKITLKYAYSSDMYTSAVTIEEGAINFDVNAGTVYFTGYGVLLGKIGETLQLVMVNASDLDLNINNLRLNNAGLNAASGLVQLDSNRRLPAVDGSQLTNLPAATVDLSNYSTSTIQLTSTDGTIKLINGNNNGSIQLVATNDEYPDRATFQTPGVWDIKLDSYLTKISGTQQMDIEANGSACPVKITAGSNGGDIELEASGTLKYNGADLNTANGLVQLGSDGMIPTSLYNAGGGSVDLSNYEGDGVSMNLTTDFEVYCGEIKLDASGNLYLTAFDLFYNGAASNAPNGLVLLGDDGKIPPSLYEAGSGGDTSALEERVTTLEGTVGTLDAAVDEILADYGEGSGALVYRVVTSATEPENPTEGMIWIQTT